LPAEKFRLRERGRIAQGYFADIAVIAPLSLKVNATDDDPHRYSGGIKYLLVNGTLSINEFEATGERSGRGLRRT
jgi:N-acyl-D-amino-acid deacylase